MAERHVADAETTFLVVNVTPDFCKVGNQVIPFDIYQVLSSEKAAYSPDVLARGQKVLTMGSLVSGVIGNAGQGVASTVSGPSGHTVIVEGDPNCLVDGKPVARHLDRCLMNVKV